MNARQFKGEDGQTLILVMLTLPLLLAIAALVLDGSNLFVQKRSVQNAADAAAFAASAKLNTDDSACSGPDTPPTPPTPPTCAYNVRMAAQDYSIRNDGPSLHGACSTTDPTDNNCYVTPYKGENGRVQVRLRKPVSGFFTRAVGLWGASDVSATAVAGLSPASAAGNVMPVGLDQSHWSPSLIDVPNQRIDFDMSGYALLDLSHVSTTGPIVSGTSCNRATAKMNDDITYGYPGDGTSVILPINAWYCDNSGAKGGVKQGLHDAYAANTTLLVPVFDSAATGPPASYHVVGFAAFVIEQDPKPYWGTGSGNHYLIGHFRTFIASGVGGGSSGNNFGVFVVTLFE